MRPGETPQMQEEEEEVARRPWFVMANDSLVR